MRKRSSKPQYRNPSLTVDIIISIGDRGSGIGDRPESRIPNPESQVPTPKTRCPTIILIKRKNPPPGWAIPGGFVDYGETVEHAAAREAKEETSLDLRNLRQFHVYSDPKRDPRGHTVSVIFTAEGIGTPQAADDAQEIGIFTKDSLPDKIAFDHRRILADYFRAFAANAHG